MKTIEIKKWLLDKGLRQIDIARSLGVSHTTVNYIISGRFKSARVVQKLIELGCPAEFLGIDESSPDLKVA